MRARANNTQEKTYTKVESFSVRNSREWENGNVTSTVTINGVTIYNVHIKQTKDGNHEFLAFPSRKSNDGKYYPYVYIALSDEDTTKIIEAIDNDLAKSEG